MVREKNGPQGQETGGKSEKNESALYIDKKGALNIGLVGKIESTILSALMDYLEDAKKVFRCKTARKKHLKITITICSPGGDSAVGLAIYDLIRSSGLPVRTRALGEVSSAALAVFLAGRERLMFENACLFSHKTDQEMEGCSRQEKETILAQLQAEDEKYASIILENSKMTRRQLDKFEGLERRITAQEAVELGLAHEIIKNI